MKLDLDNYVPGLLLWLSNKIASSATQVYRSRFDIGVTDWRVLAYFEVYTWSTASSACELMGLDKAAVSRSIAFLVSKGWLHSRPAGLRKVEYETTPRGKTFHRRVFAVAMARERALLDGMNKSDQKQLVRLLHHMLRNLDRVDAAGYDS